MEVIQVHNNPGEQRGYVRPRGESDGRITIYRLKGTKKGNNRKKVARCVE